MKHLMLSALLVAHTAMVAQAQTSVISGRIRSADGQAAAGVRVALASPNANGEITSDMLGSITTTDVTGHYSIDNVPPGRYGIIAGPVSSPTFYPGKAIGSLATILTIARGSTITGVDFTLVTLVRTERGPMFILLNPQNAGPRQTIRGSVVLDGPLVSAFLPELKINFIQTAGISSSTVSPFNGGPALTSRPLSSIWAAVKPDGSFKIELEADGYLISVTRADNKPLLGFVLKSITLGAFDLLRETAIINGAIPGEIRITLTPVQVNRPIK